MKFATFVLLETLLLGSFPSVKAAGAPVIDRKLFPGPGARRNSHHRLQRQSNHA
jgi:hypothetical protein